MKIDREFLDNLSIMAKHSQRLRMNYDLRDSPEDTSMRMLNALEPGTTIPIHRHNDTSEDVVCIRGCVDEIIFDKKGVEIGRYRLKYGSDVCACHIEIGQYHTCVAIEPGSVIIEFKNGTYDPVKTEDIL